VQQSFELCQRGSFALRDDIDRTLVVGIHDPSDHAKPISLTTHPPPEADSLDATHDPRR